MLVGAFNQEKALVGAFSVIVKTDGLFAALLVMFSASCQFHQSGGQPIFLIMTRIVRRPSSSHGCL